MLARLLEIAAENWLLVALTLGAVACGFLFWRRLGDRSTYWSSRFLSAVLLALLAFGHFLPGRLESKLLDSTEISALVACVGLGGMFTALVVLIANGRWSWFAAALSAAVLVAGVGGIIVAPVQKAVLESVRSLRTLEFVHPGWLVALLAVPLVIVMSSHSLAGLGNVRRWLALGGRCLLVTLLALALAEPRLSRPNENVAVLYVVDRSLSVPQDVDPATAESPGGIVDRRWQRIQEFINDAVSRRGHAHRNDASGVIFFARRPRLILPATPVDRMHVSDTLAGKMDANYTDIASAMKLAMASFPEGMGKRIVLITDGNENLGNAEEQANLARQNKVQIDAIPLAPGYRNTNEVLVQSVEAPPRTTRGARLPIRVLVRNAHPARIVYGKLELLQSRDGRERPVPIQPGIDVLDSRESPALVRLRPGLNAFTFRDKADVPGKEEEFSFSYRAVFQPVESRDQDNRNAIVGLPGDRVQNNKGFAHVIARGQRRVLFVEADGESTHSHLIDQLRRAKFTIIPITASRLPQNKGDLAVFLSNYDCVVIADVPSELITREQQEVIRSNTHDQGCGLVVIGGPESYGAGGYQKTPIEAALPVDCEIKAMKAAGRGGLVLIMHASEMADGNTWQKRIAKLAIERLAPIDMVGVLYYDTNPWNIEFQTVGGDKSRLYSRIDRMTPGDMPNFDPFLKMAYDTLSTPEYGLATKHVILISDGDPSLGGAGQSALSSMEKASITCTTVGVATHGAPENARLQQIADSAYKGSKFYNVTDPSKLPGIYIKESRRVSQSFVYTERFNPKLVLRGGPTEKLDDPLPDLHGFIRTTLKPSPLAEMLIEGPRTFDQRFPILAAWQYGLGRSVAWTSDAKSVPEKVEGWDRHWTGSEMYLKFWEQCVGWALRGLETDRLTMTTEYRDGKVKVTVEARDDNNKPITDLRLEGAVTTPSGDADGAKPIQLTFEQRAGGVYEAEFKAEEAGTYLVNARAKQSLPLFPDGKPRYKGRFRDGLPMTVTDDGTGKLRLADGTEVKRRPDGSFVYADDGKPVEIQDRVDKVIDSRRTGVSLSYSPEFGDLESNTPLLNTLTRVTNGKVYSEDSAELKTLAESGELYRPAPAGSVSHQALWHWLVFLAGMVLLFDVGVRRIAIEAHEVRDWSVGLWTRLRNKAQASEAQADAFLSRLKQRKVQAEETIEKEKAARRFDAPAETPVRALPGADAIEPPKPAIQTPAPPTLTAKPKPTEEEEDFFSKLRRAKKRAPHERRDDESPPAGS